MSDHYWYEIVRDWWFREKTKEQVRRPELRERVRLALAKRDPTLEHDDEAEWMALSNEIDRVSNVVPQAEAEAVWLGDGKVRVGERVIALDGQYAAVVQALLELGGAAMKKELVDHSGVSNAPGVLTKLRKKYPALAPYITMPGVRGRGGYSTTIRPK